jgi:hypothetical protein
VDKHNLNPIQLNCPECQKLFRVSVADLAPGPVRFQCTQCRCFFGFDWPQPPGVVHIRALPLEPAPEFIKAVGHPSAQASIATLPQPLQICPRCEHKSSEDLSECPKCGVIFDKVARLKDKMIVKATSPEVDAMWEDVKKDFGNQSLHEKFVQFCVAKNSLHFASSRYRAISLSNPNEEMAKKMQARILELATSAYLSIAKIRSNENSSGPEFVDGQKQNSFSFRKKVTASNLALVSGSAMIFAGILAPHFSGGIAVGTSIIVFVRSMKYFNR